MAINSNFDTAIISQIIDNVSARNIEYSKVVFLDTFENSELATKFKILLGIRKGDLVPILNNKGNAAAFPVKDENSCENSSCELDINFSIKKWETAKIACTFEICINKFSEGFLLFWNENKRIFGDANMNGALMTYLLDAIQKDLNLSIWRMAFFADETSINPFLKGMSGIFAQAESMNGFKIELEENTSNTAPTGQAIYNYLEKAYAHASVQPWFNPTATKIDMTRAMASIYVSWLNSMGDKSPYNCECYSPDGITAMRTYSIAGKLFIFGIEIRVHNELDTVIGTPSLGITHPYRAIMTNSENLLFGTTESDQLPAFKVFYSDKDDMIYVKGGATIAAALVTDQYVYIGAEVGTVIPI
jgi:hypothetical protein